MATVTHTTRYQHAVEDFIRTAESLGHRGHALLSSSHPAIRERQWTQIRTLMFGVLAFYRDELGNLVELRTINGTYPVIQQRDPRTTFYGYCRGCSEGFTVKAESRKEAGQLLAAKFGTAAPSPYLVITMKPTQGIVYAN